MLCAMDTKTRNSQNTEQADSLCASASSCTDGSSCSSCAKTCSFAGSEKRAEQAASHNCENGSPVHGDLSAPLHPKSRVKKVIGIVSGKGGVGKSLITSLLACAVRRAGCTAAVLDADITGPSIPKMFGLHAQAQVDSDGVYPVQTAGGIQVMSINFLLEHETDPVPWRGPIIAGAVKQFWTDVIWQDVDCMFVDMPPGTGDVPLTVFQSLRVDGIVVAASPQELVGMIVEKAVKMADIMHIPVLALVENMSYIECPDCGKKIKLFGESNAEPLAKKHGIPSIVKLPIDPKLAALCDAGSIEKASRPEFDALVQTLVSAAERED